MTGRLSRRFALSARARVPAPAPFLRVFRCAVLMLLALAFAYVER